MIIDIDYKVLKRNKKTSYLTRKEEMEKNFLVKELKKIKTNKEESKLNYLYKEFFSTEVKTFEDKLNILEKELNKDYNSFHHKLYTLLKLSLIRKK